MTIAKCLPERKIEFEADRSGIGTLILEMEQAIEENRLGRATELLVNISSAIHSLDELRRDIYQQHRRLFGTDHSANDPDELG